MMSERNTLPPYYTALFTAVEQAIREIDRLNFGRARELLIRGEQEAEERYLSAEEAAGEKSLSKI